MTYRLATGSIYYIATIAAGVIVIRRLTLTLMANLHPCRQAVWKKNPPAVEDAFQHATYG